MFVKLPCDKLLSLVARLPFAAAAPASRRPQRKLIFRVHVEHANRRPSDWRLADNVYSSPPKVIFPLLVPRMKQLGDSTSFRVDPRQVWALVKITVNASQSQIV